MSAKPTITIEATVNAPVEKVWSIWNTPAHIIQWNTGHPDWHTPRAEVDLRPGGKFLSHMAAKDGSASFDFIGTYDDVQLHTLISYTIEDRRKVKNSFAASGNTTKIVVVFEAENENSLELQREGWQTILNNFKKHVETNG